MLHILEQKNKILQMKNWGNCTKTFVQFQYKTWTTVSMKHLSCLKGQTNGHERERITLNEDFIYEYYTVEVNNWKTFDF